MKVNCFPKRKDTKLGVRKNCKECRSFQFHNYRENNLEIIKQQQKVYYSRNSK